MDPRQSPDSSGVEPDGHDETGLSASDGTGRPAQEEPGQSSGDVLTVCLFGAMVVIASVCFVIW